MKNSYSVSTLIAAAPEKIWPLLTDASHYTDWNPTVERVEGDIAPGETITIYARVSPGRAFPVKVVELTEPTRMVWEGGMPLGLFKGVRTFTLQADAWGSTEFNMEEHFTGPMSGMICKKMPDLTPSFEQFAESLKRAAESGDELQQTPEQPEPAAL